MGRNMKRETIRVDEKVEEWGFKKTPELLGTDDEFNKLMLKEYIERRNKSKIEGHICPKCAGIIKSLPVAFLFMDRYGDGYIAYGPEPIFVCEYCGYKTDEPTLVSITGEVSEGW